MINTKNWTGIFALLFSLPLFASDLTISDAWTRATTQGHENGMVGLTITSPKKARIIAVTSPAYAATEMQKLSSVKGKHNAVTLKSISLPANKTIVFSPEGFHLALLGNKQTLSASQKVPVIITVKFENNETKEFSFMAQPVRIRAGSAPLPMANPVAIQKTVAPMVTMEPLITIEPAIEIEPATTNAPTTNPPEVELFLPAAIAEPAVIAEPVVVAEPVNTVEPVIMAEPAPAAPAEVAPEVKLAEQPVEATPGKVEDCLKYAVAIKACDQAGGVDEIMECRSSSESKYGCTPMH